MDPLNARLNAITDTANKQNRRRSLEPITGAQGREVDFNGSALINFASNDYLGLSAHKNIVTALREAATRHGAGSGAAALLSGRSTVHAELEQRIAKLMQRDAALLFSSGYLANIGLLASLIQRHDHVFHDRLNHASLIDGVSITKAKSTRYPHGETQALDERLGEDNSPRRWLVTDAVFSMDGDVAPLNSLAKLAQKHDAVLIADDAHGFGVLGNGAGTGVSLSLTSKELPIQVVTFGKALGTAGAAVVGSYALIDALIQASRTFIYDTAPPPCIAAATIASLDMVEGDAKLLADLNENIGYFRSRAAHLPIGDSTTPIQPVMLGSEEKAINAAKVMRAHGIYARAIRPPTVPAGTSRLRLCLSAAHTRGDIDRLVDALNIATGDTEI